MAIEATRTQVPLKPAFAMTIHKSQGMTLERLIVDCHMINRPGQFGVAVGRAKSTSGLQLLHFRKACSVPQPNLIHEYYEGVLKDSVVNEDLSCCHVTVTEEMILSGRISGELEDELNSIKEIDAMNEEDMIGIDQQLEEEIVQEEEYALPNGYNVTGLLDSCMKYTPASTAFQNAVNEQILKWKSNSLFENFLAWERHQIIVMVAAHMAPGESATQKEESALYSDFRKHVTSDKHKAQVLKLFAIQQLTDVTEEQWDATYQVMVELRRREIDSMARSMNAPTRHISGISHIISFLLAMFYKLHQS
jgi:hypothetical protein